MPKYLHVQLQMLQLRNFREVEDEYISILWGQQFYFSAVYRSSLLDQNLSISFNDNFLLPIFVDLPPLLLLQNWQNHMILFQHQIDISQLHSRTVTRKKHEIRQGQLLSFTVNLLQPNEYSVCNRLITSISQHYLIIKEMKLLEADSSGQDHGPSYFSVVTNQGRIIVPVLNSVVNIQIPNEIQFLHIKNGKLKSKSRKYTTQQLIEEIVSVRMVMKQQQGYDLQVKMQWGINLWKHRFQTSILLDAHEILIYDLEVRFQNQKLELTNSYKLKVTCGSKAYQLNGDLDASKIIRFARIIYFIIKSQEEEFSIILERNFKTTAKAVFATDEIISYHLNTVKQKMIDLVSQKSVASVRFKCEKAKTLSLPQNNKFWKSCNKKKGPQSIMLEFSQLSLKKEDNKSYAAVIKTEDQQVYISALTNFCFFKLQSQIPEPVTLNLKSSGNIYIKVIQDIGRQHLNENQFQGICVVNQKQLRLGVNCVCLSCFKNQQTKFELNLIINKVMPWPFIKSTFQPEPLTSSTYKTIGVSVLIKRIYLTEYYYTYQYDNKSQLYCIIEINRIKKVLILERFNSKVNKLLFMNAQASDHLNFIVDEQEYIKLRVTLLISDDGYDEQIYGQFQIKMKASDLKTQQSFDYKSILILNDYGTNVGEVDFQVQKGAIGEFKRGPIKKDLKNVQNQLDKVNKSIEDVQKSMEKKKKQFSLKKQSPAVLRRRKGVDTHDLKLPEIRSSQPNKQQKLKNLAKMYQMRKRDGVGRYQKKQQLAKDTLLEYQPPERQTLQEEQKRPISRGTKYLLIQKKEQPGGLQQARESGVAIQLGTIDLQQNEFAQFNEGRKGVGE